MTALTRTAQILTALRRRGETLPDATLTSWVPDSPYQQDALLAFLTSDHPALNQMPIRLQHDLRRLQTLGSPLRLLPTCPHCRRTKELNSRARNGQRVCATCAVRDRAEPCTGCGRTRSIAARRGGQPFCYRCHRPDLHDQHCDGCGRDKSVGVATVEGVTTCLACRPKTIVDCASCGKSTVSAAMLLGGPQCAACYRRITTVTLPCPGCRRSRRIAYLNSDGQPTCASCAGVPVRYACRRCGREDQYYGRLCAPCTVHDHLADLLRTDDPDSPLHAYAAHLKARPDTLNTLRWLLRTPLRPTLRAIAARELPLSHDTLDALPHDQSVIQLRRIFIELGLLPPLSIRLRDLELWVNQQLSLLPRGDATLIGSYYRWHVLRRAATEPGTDELLDGAARHARFQIRQIVTFRAWLDERGSDLGHVNQTLVDHYCAMGDRSRWMPPFLRWLQHNGAAERDLTVPSQPRAQPNITLADDELVRLVALLGDPASGPPDLRLIALFAAVFGQPITRTTRMKLDQLHDAGDTLRVTVGSHPVSLPGPMAETARQAYVAAVDARSPWLFPGRNPTQHRTAHSVANYLRRLGTTAAQLQQAARLYSATVLNTKVMADALGLSTGTTIAYWRLSGASWSDAPAAHQYRSHR